MIGCAGFTCNFLELGDAMTVPDILPLEPKLSEAISRETLPEQLGFGHVKVAVMAHASYREGAWSPVKLKAYEPICMDPSAKALHYGQQVFEGMKCYKNGDELALFRPDLNWKRFNYSCHRLAMPEIPESLFMQAVASMCHHVKPLVPGGEGESLYIRPFAFASEPGLGLAVSKDYEFYVIVTPSGGYFSASEVHVLIERTDCRAAPGGTGAAKVAGNYAGSLKSLINSQQKGYQQNLWLDAEHKRYIEELSGMNVFSVINGELHTPKLSGTILPGVTRDSLICLGKAMGISVVEREMDIDELVAAIKDGSCTEMFACGTAAVLTPIAALGEADGTRYVLKESFGPLSQSLRKKLVDIQRQKDSDPYGWVVRVP